MRLVSLLLCAVISVTAFSGIPLCETVAADVQNLAYQKTAFSSTGYHDNGQWNLASLTDGKKLITSDYAANAGFHSQENETSTIVGIDLGSVQQFNNVILYPRIDDQTGGKLVNYVEDFTIEVGDGNDNWKTVKTITGNTNPNRDPQEFIFESESAQYVRINVTKTTGGGTTLALAEMEVYYTDTQDQDFEKFSYNAFSDDFSSQTLSDKQWALSADSPQAPQTPVIQNGEYVLDRGIHANIRDMKFDTALYEADVKVENGADWIGLLFNKIKVTDMWNDSGYLLYLRNDQASGDIAELMSNGQSLATVKEIPNHVAGEYINLKVLCDSGNIKVYLNDEKVIDITDNNYGVGYADFFVSGGQGNGRIDNVSVRTLPKIYEDKTDVYMDSLKMHKILRDDISVRFPELSEGHRRVINASSEPDVIDTEGKVTPPEQDINVTLNVTVTCINPEKSVTEDITYTVPRKSTEEDVAFMKDLEYGLFFHYIWGGQGNGTTTIDENGNSPDNIHDFVNNFDVDQVVEDCEKFNAQYVIFTAWHYKMNPLYNSEVYRAWRSDAEENNPSVQDRDIIMELADKLSAKGIDLFLYTHPNDLHDFSAEDQAKFDYKYQGDTTFDKELWNDYLTAQYKEVTERYQGKIKGYFLDEGLGSPSNDKFVDYDRLRAVIKDIDPNMGMIQNWSEVPGAGSYKCDTGMVEDRIQTSWGQGDWGDSLKTSIKNGDSWPSFGIPFAARIGERPFNWSAFYDKDGKFHGNDTQEFMDKDMVIASPEDIFRYTIYQAASNSEGMGSCWAFGPYSGLDNTSIWEPGVEKTFDKVGSLLKPIQESVFGTKPSKSWPAKVDVDKLKPRVKTGSMGAVSYVAMSSSDEQREFVHVLNPKLEGGAVSGRTLTLPVPLDGKNYNKATLVKDGTSLEFEKNSNGSLSITLDENQTWDKFDTAIELTAKETTIDDYTYTVFEDNFEDTTESNKKWTVAPTIINGETIIELGKHYNPKDLQTGNAVYEFSWSCNAADWIGIQLNRENPNHIWDNSGCLIYMRNDGKIEAAGNGVTIVGGTGQIANYTAGEMISLRILSEGGNITVYSGDTVVLTLKTGYTYGYPGFFSSGNSGNGKLDNVIVKTLPPTQDSEEEINKIFDRVKEDLKASHIYIDAAEISNLPKVDEKGYSYTIKNSTDESIVSLDGVVVPPSKAKEVTITYELKYVFDGADVKTDECEVTYKVKAKTTEKDIAYFLDDKYGLFVHYVWTGARRIGNGGQPEEISARYADGTKAKTIDEMIENFDAVQFAQDCKDMGMQYVIFTAWHYGTNPVYPSDVYNEWRTHESGDIPTDDGNHDLIDKVYQELNKQGIDLYLYTHPYDIHDLYDEDKKWLEYDYTGDLDFNYAGWNDYLNAQYKELCERYKGKIKGMFLDEGLANPANNLSVDYPRLRDTVKSVDPSLLMMQNEYNGKYSCDTSMWELPTAWHGGNYNDLSSWQTNTLPIGTSIGNIYQGYSWWAIKNRNAGTAGLETAENAYLYTVLQAGTNTEGGGMAWAAGPYCGNDGTGIWEDGVKETLVKMYDYMKPIEKAIKNTRPSKSYITKPYSTYATVDWGVATESANGRSTYLHIIKPPADGKTITIGVPKDGKEFVEAKLLATGETVTMNQNDKGVTLNLPETADWDALNTVIELTTSKEGALQQSIKKAENALKNNNPWMYSEEPEEVLNEAIEEAKTVAANPDATEEQLKTMETKVETALDAYEQSVKKDSVAGENYASGKSVTSSSSLEESGFSSAYLTDSDKYGNKNRGWTSNPHSTVPDRIEWVQVDLGESERVGRVDLSPGNTNGYGFPENFYVEISEDGQNYKKVYEQYEYRSDGSVLQVHFAAEKAQYVRITGTKLTPDQPNGQSYRMQLSEVEVYPMSVEEAAYRVSMSDTVKKGKDTRNSSEKFVMPTAPEGFTVTKISFSSNEDIISLDGIVSTPKKNKNVDLRFEVQRDSDGATASTRTMKFLVQGKKVNKAELEALLASLKDLDLSKYTEESVKIYKEALDNANKIMEDTSLTASDQQIVDDCIKALEQAQNQLVVKNDKEEERKKADKTELERLLASLINLDLSKYTEESVNAYKEVQEKANRVMKDTSLTEKEQQIVDDAIKELEQAKNGLVIRNNKTDKPENDKNTEDKKTEIVNGKESSKIEQVKTGDMSNIRLYMGLLLACGTIIVCFIIGKKKVNK